MADEDDVADATRMAEEHLSGKTPEPRATEDGDTHSERFNISAGYYPDIEESKLWGGWIEDDAKRWIIFLDKDGRPSVYFPVREANGGIKSNPQRLDNSSGVGVKDAH
jgi:hypothetical protein